MGKKAIVMYMAIIIAFVVISLFAATILLETDSYDTRQVRLQLKWKHQFQFAGYYAAKEKGFFEDEGLSVDILPYDGMDPVQSVIDGKAEFGIGNSELLVSKAKGNDVVVLAAVFQHSPLVFLTKEDSGIQSVQDFIGKRVAMEEQSAELDVFLKSEGIDRSVFRALPHETTTQQLVNGEVDVMSAYLTDEPYELEREGVRYRVISARNSGIDFYGDCLFTTKEMVDKNPELVAAMVAASLKGWSYAFDNEEELISMIRSKYDMRHSDEHLSFEASQMKRMVLPDAIEIGYMNVNRWKAIESAFLTYGVISAPVDMDEFIYGISGSNDRTENWASDWACEIAVFLMMLFVILVYSFMRTKNSRVRRNIGSEIEHLEHENQKMKSIVDSLHCPLIIITMEKDEILFANEAAKQTFSVDGNPIGKRAVDFYARPDQSRLIKNEIRNTGGVIKSTMELIKATGERIWVSGTFFAAEYDGIKAIYASLMDVTEHKKTEQLLTASQERLQNMTDQLPVAIMECDADGHIIFANKTCLDIFRVDSAKRLENVVGNHIPLKDINRLSFKDHQVVTIQMDDYDERYYDMSIAYRMESGIITAYYVVLSDITNMKLAEEKLKLMAVTDELTGLVNRREFYRRAAIELVRANRNATMLSVVMMDIDHFKLVNDTFGHDIGDLVLGGLGKLLASTVRASDIVSRFGGEEMVILLPETDTEAAVEFAERLRGQMERLRFESREGIEFKVTASFGIARFNPLEEKQDMDSLIQKADVALYEAKNTGRNRVVVYHTIQE